MRKERKKGRNALKDLKPSIYHGDASFERFEAWAEEVQEWRDDFDLSEYATVTTMRHLVAKSAKEWYRMNVRGKEEKWGVDALMDALFDDVFPSNFAEVMRETFDAAHQGSYPVKRWYRHLTRIARRVTVITPHEIMRKFWKGSAPYLQEKWAEMGWSAEDPELKIESLYESALRYERARGFQKAEQNRRSST